MSNKYSKGPWLWVPSLYFAEGLPYAFVMLVSVIMYKKLDISNTEIALYTSWLYLPWVIKPLWSPIVDILRTRRSWIVLMQLLIGAGLAGVAFTIPSSNPLRFSLAFFWLISFSSATHDIAADGFYMHALSKHEQTWMIGIRNTFYRFAILFGQGILIIVAGKLEIWAGDPVTAWSITFGVLCIMFIVFSVYHWLILPKPLSDQNYSKQEFKSVLYGFFQVLLPDGQVVYTRNGAFSRNNEGILTTNSGFIIQPEVAIPAEATKINVSADGIVSVQIPEQVEAQEVGQLQLADFQNRTGLQPIGENFYVETTSSGPPVIENPFAAGFGKIIQGALESSNVNVVQELVDMIETQRAYEINSKAISGVDDMLRFVNQNL